LLVDTYGKVVVALPACQSVGQELAACKKLALGQSPGMVCQGWPGSEKQIIEKAG
jgi:hypothetical protein